MKRRVICFAPSTKIQHTILQAVLVQVFILNRRIQTRVFPKVRCRKLAEAGRQVARFDASYWRVRIARLNEWHQQFRDIVTGAVNNAHGIQQNCRRHALTHGGFFRKTCYRTTNSIAASACHASILQYFVLKPSPIKRGQLSNQYQTTKTGRAVCGCGGPFGAGR